jgi:hypothetical protein
MINLHESNREFTLAITPLFNNVKYKQVQPIQSENYNTHNKKSPFKIRWTFSEISILKLFVWLQNVDNITATHHYCHIIIRACIQNHYCFLFIWSVSIIKILTKHEVRLANFGYKVGITSAVDHSIHFSNIVFTAVF